MNNNIIIKLENKFYYAGDTIKGSIYAKIENNIKCPGLELKIKGKEILKANPEIENEEEEEEDENNEDIHKKELENLENPYKYYDNIDIIKYKIFLTNKQELQTGNYIFPFTIKLPNSLSGSCLIYDKNIIGEIYYYIKIKGEDQNGKIIKEYTPLIIRQNRSNFQYKTLNSIIKTFPNFCCCKKGKVKLNCEITNDYFFIGENIKVNINVDNKEGKLEGGPLTLFLYKKITLHPNQKDILEIPKIIGKETDENKIDSNSEFSSSIEIENEIIYPESNNIFQNCKSYKIINNVNKLMYLSSSCLGNSFSCEYEVFTNINFSGWVSDELGIFISAILYPNENLLDNENNQNQDFINWNGKKMENIHIQLNDKLNNIFNNNNKDIINDNSLNFIDKSSRELNKKLKVEEIELTDLNKENKKENENVIQKEKKNKIKKQKIEKKVKTEINIKEQSTITEEKNDNNLSFKKDFNKDWIDDDMNDEEEEKDN